MTVLHRQPVQQYLATKRHKYKKRKEKRPMFQDNYAWYIQYVYILPSPTQSVQIRAASSATAAWRKIVTSKISMCCKTEEDRVPTMRELEVENLYFTRILV